MALRATAKAAAPYAGRYALCEMMNNHETKELWSVVGNIRKEIPFGPGVKEIKSGLKQFKTGAKVHIIGSYPGMCENVIALGHHRKSGKYIHCVIKVMSL